MKVLRGTIVILKASHRAVSFIAPAEAVPTVLFIQKCIDVPFKLGRTATLETILVDFITQAPTMPVSAQGIVLLPTISVNIVEKSLWWSDDDWASSSSCAYKKGIWQHRGKQKSLIEEGGLIRA